MAKHLLLFFTLSLITICAFAQEKHPICGADEHHAQLYQHNAQYRASYDETKAYLAKLKINNYKTVTTMSGTEFHVPIVVHVLHTGLGVGTNYNPSVATINALIAQINNGFANTFNDPTIAGGFNGVNIPIRFYLAQRDEAGCVATTGIRRVNMSSNGTYVSSGVRRNSSQPGVTDATIKAEGSWNDLNYYNIYIVNKINGEDGYTTTGSFVAGYANYPVLGGTGSDGMVCLAYSAAQATSTTFIHELGHGFDLAHTFEGGTSTICPPNGNCNTDNDEVCDTEPMRQSLTCNPSGNNPCTSAPYAGGQWNYMSYNGCTDRYTPGQSARVMNIINTVRTGYKNSAAIDPPPASLPTAIAGPGYSNAANNFNMGPRRVQFNAIDFTSNGYSFEGTGNIHYIDNTCNQGTTVLAGSTYTLDVNTMGNTQDCRVYIDYNNDGVFNPTAERVLNSNATAAPQLHTANVTIPANAIFNTPLRMRVIADFSSATITPTGSLTYGQAEDYMITIIGAPLPVVWRSISAQLNTNNNINLRWSTEMEINVSRFEIEKSKDGEAYYRIGNMKPIGNSSLPSYYSFEDKENIAGYNYYRIKQIDIDGVVSHSKVATEVVQSTNTEVVIFPNPTDGELNINLVGMPLDKNVIQYSITNLNGQVLINNREIVNMRNTKIKTSLKTLPDGMYFVRLKINNDLSIQRLLSNRCKKAIEKKAP